MQSSHPQSHIQRGHLSFSGRGGSVSSVWETEEMVSNLSHREKVPISAGPTDTMYRTWKSWPGLQKPWDSLQWEPTQGTLDLGDLRAQSGPCVPHLRRAAQPCVPEAPHKAGPLPQSLYSRELTGLLPFAAAPSPEIHWAWGILRGR